MQVDVVSIFPDMFAPILGVGMTGRAIARGLLTVQCTDPREFTEDQVHRFRAWMAQDRARLGPASGAEPTRDA